MSDEAASDTCDTCPHHLCVVTRAGGVPAKRGVYSTTLYSLQKWKSIFELNFKPQKCIELKFNKHVSHLKLATLSATGKRSISLKYERMTCLHSAASTRLSRARKMFCPTFTRIMFSRYSVDNISPLSLPHLEPGHAPAVCTLVPELAGVSTRLHGVVTEFNIKWC